MEHEKRLPTYQLVPSFYLPVNLFKKKENLDTHNKFEIHPVNYILFILNIRKILYFIKCYFSRDFLSFINYLECPWGRGYCSLRRWMMPRIKSAVWIKVPAFGTCAMCDFCCWTAEPPQRKGRRVSHVMKLGICLQNKKKPKETMNSSQNQRYRGKNCRSQKQQSGPKRLNIEYISLIVRNGWTADS